MGITGEQAIWEAETEGLELLHVTIGDMLDQQARQYADREALVYHYPERGLQLRLTYRQYRDEANRLARGLLALGIEKGEHVAVWAPNVPEWALLQMALAKIGAVMVTVNTAYRTAELEYVLRQGDVTTLFLVEALRGNSYLDSLYNIVPELTHLTDPVHETVQSTRLPRFKRAVVLSETPRPGLICYSQVAELGALLSDELVVSRQASVTPQDVVQIQYTSGTTGFPKGAMLTHYGHLNNGYLYAKRGNFQPDDRNVAGVPFFHVSGCVLGILGTLVTGGTYIPLITFDPVKNLELIESERATLCFGVPTMLMAMLNHPRFLAGEFDTSSLRAVGTGGSPVPVVLMEQVKARMGADALIVFGMTEGSGVMTQTRLNDSFELKTSTVGLPLPHTEARIINPATGSPVGFSEPGELIMRGFLVMKGYYQMPEKTAQAIDTEGWLHSGDLATMNPQGYLNIVGRLKDMVIRGGENLYPAEIEQFLMRHPDVAEAQVVGVPDPYMVEEMVALLKLKPGVSTSEEEIRQYCQSAISRNKIPRYIRFVDEYPLTASGKVKKFELRAQMIEALGLQDVAKTQMA